MMPWSKSFRSQVKHGAVSLERTAVEAECHEGIAKKRNRVEERKVRLPKG
jgi:hypothetical protein